VPRRPTGQSVPGPTARDRIRPLAPRSPRRNPARVLSSLPIDAFLPEILASLERVPRLVLVAEPGAGKTTRVPAALLASSFARDGRILVLEPRRIAARMAARRVASELGERVGQRIGYNVRFERQQSAETRVLYLTEALLTRRILEDDQLRGVSCVVLDEFHERSLHTDLGLALLRRLARGPRPELRIVVMSATLDAERVASFLDAPVMRVPGRVFPVDIEYLERPDERKLEEQVRGAVRKLLVRKIDGDVLVFLPGAAEIRRAAQACQELIAPFGVEIATLHGDLPPAEQDRALVRGERPKIVLSTNIAETSLTLEGVAAVVDSGLARVAGHSPWSGLSTLTTQKVSQASAIQRAGRAGRVRAGHCLRLFTKADFDGRPRFDVPELAKADLCETELFLRSVLGAAEAELAWLEAPPAAARTAALSLLSRLGALEEDGRASALGRVLLELPVHPRVGRFATALAERGYHEEAASMAALLGEREIRLVHRTSFGGAQRANDEVGASDLLARFHALEALRGDHSAENARRHELDPGAVRAVEQSRNALRRSLDRVARRVDQEFEEAAHSALLLAFPDRVGKRRAPRSAEIVLSGGGSATLAEASVVKEAELMVVFDADERGGAAAVIRGASSIEPEWLLEYFPERVRSERRVSFDAQRERVESSEQMLYDALVLDETRRAGAPGPAEAALLADAALARGAAAPWDVDAVDQWCRRSLFAAQHDSSVRAISPEQLRAALLAHCAGKLSFEELRRAPFEEALPELVDPALRAALARLAPARVKLPSGRELKVHYELDRPPWVESRLQDFFGLLDGPRLAGGKVPLVLHLLAPNQRPVQVSTDLRGFWDKHYPAIRKELMRRYPRHSWPEDPRSAEPPAPRRK
jgi:ATP-dependent helicase HrpB